MNIAAMIVHPEIIVVENAMTVPTRALILTVSSLVLLESYVVMSVFICPIAIAYSMGQIIKSVCVCQCVCPSASTLTVTFLDRFSPTLAQTEEPRKVRTSSLGVNIAPTLPLFCP